VAPPHTATQPENATKAAETSVTRVIEKLQTGKGAEAVQSINQTYQDHKDDAAFTAAYAQQLREKAKPYLPDLILAAGYDKALPQIGTPSSDPLRDQVFNFKLLRAESTKNMALKEQDTFLCFTEPGREPRRDPQAAALEKVREQMKPEPNELKDQARINTRKDGSFETFRFFPDGRYDQAIFRPDGSRDIKAELNTHDKSAFVTVYGKDGKRLADMLVDKSGDLRVCHGYENGKMTVELILDSKGGGQKVTYNPATRERTSVHTYKDSPDPIKHIPAIKRVAEGIK